MTPVQGSEDVETEAVLVDVLEVGDYDGTPGVRLHSHFFGVNVVVKAAPEMVVRIAQHLFETVRASIKYDGKTRALVDFHKVVA